MNMSSYIPYPGVDAPTPDVYSRVLVAGFGKSEKPVTNRIGETDGKANEKKNIPTQQLLPQLPLRRATGQLQEVPAGNRAL